MVPILKEIARQLKDNNKKVQLLYAVDGLGKTRFLQDCSDSNRYCREGLIQRRSLQLLYCAVQAQCTFVLCAMR